MDFGPTLPISEELHQTKYRGDNETFYEYATRTADALKDSDHQFRDFRNILLDMRFLPGGRVQSAMGSPRQVTPYNCFVSMTIPDAMSGIMRAAAEAVETMRMGGGIGYDFSTLRPRGDRITKLDSPSSGPVSFMDIFNACCGTISSAGHRRGAQMGVMRVDHPDIEEFVRAKQNHDKLTNFNISVGVTDEFMRAVKEDDDFPLQFNGTIYKWIKARKLWDEIMRSTWNWAEPGVLFLDRINEMNNLWYCETIAATNPCAEQPLPPYGACLLGSFNLVKYLDKVYCDDTRTVSYILNLDMLRHDIPTVVRAMDNVVDRAIYPLPEQEKEAKNKRRMGLGVTGLANAIEAMGYPYGSEDFLWMMEEVLDVLCETAYRASVELSIEKGPFPLYDERYVESKFIQRLSPELQDLIQKYGIRNSHLISIAPTGTISLTADNISSGIEPTYTREYERTIQTWEGPRIEPVTDYGWRVLGVRTGKVAADCSAEDHLRVLQTAYRHVDSAVSKTVNVSPNMPWEEFKDVYMRAWEAGCKGCTTFNPGGKRFGILNAKPRSEEEEGAACYIDAETGKKTCE